jgi:hypothetical protein
MMRCGNSKIPFKFVGHLVVGGGDGGHPENNHLASE